VADTLTPARRSALMSKVGQKHTKPELIIRKLLHAKGWRYRLHPKSLPGTPDLVLKSRNAAVFVHGCFWHGHDCKLGRLPKTRTEFWMDKVAGNKARDLRKANDLLNHGWRVLTVWQCALDNPKSALHCIEEFLSGESLEGEIALANLMNLEE
jgi:DNA mismatch endonuclease (patch repair protein)